MSVLLRLSFNFEKDEAMASASPALVAPGPSPPQNVALMNPASADDLFPIEPPPSVEFNEDEPPMRMTSGSSRPLMRSRRSTMRWWLGSRLAIVPLIVLSLTAASAGAVVGVSALSNNGGNKVDQTTTTEIDATTQTTESTTTTVDPTTTTESTTTTQPPETAPSSSSTPATPPITSPPVTNPPVTAPPATNPPVTSPPVTNPPFPERATTALNLSCSGPVNLSATARGGSQTRISVSGPVSRQSSGDTSASVSWTGPAGSYTVSASAMSQVQVSYIDHLGTCG